MGLYSTKRLVLFGCVALCGCAASTTLDEYHGISWQDSGNYRVMDKPDAQKLLIVPVGATGQRFMALAFGTGSVDSPKPVMENAALQFLSSSGRPNCRTVDAYLLESPGWEVKYDCPASALRKPTTQGRP